MEKVSVSGGVFGSRTPMVVHPGTCCAGASKQLSRSAKLRSLPGSLLTLRASSFRTDLGCRLILRRRWRIPSHAIKKIIRPAVGHDHAGNHDQEQRHGAPESQKRYANSNPGRDAMARRAGA